MSRALWAVGAVLLAHCSVQSIPSSNFVRFRAIELQRPLEGGKGGRFRRLLEEAPTSTVNALAEIGVARKFGKDYDGRFINKKKQPNLKRAVNSTAEACVNLCVETASCRSWYLDEKSVCFLYYLTVRGHPLKGVASGDYDPPPVTIVNGLVADVGGHACVCGSQEALNNATSVTTRENLLATFNGQIGINLFASVDVGSNAKGKVMLPLLPPRETSHELPPIRSTPDETFTQIAVLRSELLAMKATLGDQVRIAIWLVMLPFRINRTSGAPLRSKLRQSAGGFDAAVLRKPQGPLTHESAAGGIEKIASFPSSRILQGRTPAALEDAAP